MKALAAERAEVVQEGCKPEFGIAQREMKMAVQKQSLAFADQDLQNRLTMGVEPEKCNMRKEGEEGN